MTFVRRAWMRGVLSVVLASALSLYLYARFVEPSWVEVRRREVGLRRMPAAFDGYRVVLIGDFHVDEWRHPARLSRVLSLVNGLRPDLVVVTGDLFSHSAAPPGPRIVSEALGALRAADGVVGVLGNHDYLANPRAAYLGLEQGGARPLVNAVHTVRRGTAALRFVGLDDAMHGAPRPEEALAALPETETAVLVVHEPDVADAAAASGRFDLQLSGHSHGGQVRLPFLTRILLPPLARRYIDGYHEVGGMPLYVNRGLGTVHLPLRFRCRPEISVITLRRA